MDFCTDFYMISSRFSMIYSTILKIIWYKFNFSFHWNPFEAQCTLRIGLQNAPYLNFKRTSAKYFWKHNRHVLWRPRLYSHVWTKVVHEVLNPVSWGRLLWWPTDGRRWSDLPGGYLVQISRFVYKLNKNNQIDFDSKSIWTSNFEVYSVYRSNFVFHFECHLSTKI